MKLNPSKCKEMLINFLTNHNFIVNPIIIGGNLIERVKAYKLLGVYISNDLKWTHHVENIVKNGNKRLYSLRVLKQCGVSPASLAKAYTTVVRPALEWAAKYTRFSILQDRVHSEKGYAHYFSLDELQ